MIRSINKNNNIFTDNKNFYTKNLVKGKRVYDEKLILKNGIEYRSWNPQKSKLAAALKKGLSQIPIKEDDIILYLGASTGTTPSHISDIIGKTGTVFALDFAPRVVKELVFLSENRPNIIPLLKDANKPESFANIITGVDFIYMDIAQKNQSDIFIKNCQVFLKKEGFGMLFVKSRSIDISKKPHEIYSEVKKQLEKNDLTIVEFRKLDPFEKDHALFIVKKK